jgi:hypothetical protein
MRVRQWVTFLAAEVLVGQALLPVRVCVGEIKPDRQECLSYAAK